MGDPSARPSGPMSPREASVWRDVRLALGVIVLLANLFLIYLDTRGHEAISTQDVVLHGLLLLTAGFLIDPSRMMQLVLALKDKIPGLGGGV